MRYLDSGSRDPSHVLGAWFQSEDPKEASSFRFQTGYFGVDGLSPILPVLEQLSDSALPIHAVVGSNDTETLQPDLDLLLGVMKTPRADAVAAVVSYSSGLFHPKVYHLGRTDGSQAAYVGSSNLGYRAVSGVNVEAGIFLDTREGDPLGILDEISAAIEAWTDGSRPGVHLIQTPTDVADLVANGVISAEPKPRESSTSSVGGNAGTTALPSLSQLLKMPRFRKLSARAGTSPSATTPPISTPPQTALPVATINPPFPGYLLFAPGVSTPTTGVDALTGTGLPSGASGLILKFSRDSVRHFDGRGGTANISIPVPALSSLRFGIYSRKYDRPRVEFDLRFRYLHAGGQYEPNPDATNIMGYGFLPGESGHGDVRMLIPKVPAAEIHEFVTVNGLHTPSDDEVLLLEWPTNADPVFKLTCFDTSHPLYKSAESTLVTAIASGNVVGQSACWMPLGFAPAW